jgi:hypothetical protein
MKFLKELGMAVLYGIGAIAVVIGGILVVLLPFAIAFGVWALIAWLAMLGWNFIAPPLFHGPEINFWQSFVAIFLLNLIGKLVFQRTVIKKE